MTGARIATRLAGAACAVLLAGGAARAADFSGAPRTVQVAPGDSFTLSFNPAALTTTLDPDSVSTGGGLLLASDPFGPDGLEVSQFEPASLIDGTLSYTAFPTPFAIPYSSADEFFGFEVPGATPSYGFAEIAGSDFVGYTVGAPGAGVTTVSSLGVPEPASLGVLTAGLVGAAAVRRRARRPV